MKKQDIIEALRRCAKNEAFSTCEYCKHCPASRGADCVALLLSEAADLLEKKHGADRARGVAEKMKITGKHELEMPFSIEFEIASAPQPEGKEKPQINPTALSLQMRANTRKIKKCARTIKKDTKLLLRTLDKMKRHGWLLVDQTDREEEPRQ